MITKLMRLLERLAAALLGSLCVSVQLANILICIFLLLMGPAFIFRFFPQ